MKRRYLFLIALAFFAAFFAAVVPWTIATAPMAHQVASHVRALTGLELRVEGRATLAFLPLPRIKLEQVTLTSAQGETVIRASQLRGELRLLPLIAGQLELADAMMLQPTITVARDGAGRSPWDETLGRLAQEVERGKPAESRLHVDRLVIVGGTLVRRDDGAGGAGDDVRDINVVVSWPASTSAVDVAGSVAWRGEPVEVKMTGLSPAKLLAGQTSDVTLRLKLPHATVALNGEIAGRSDPQFKGTLSFKTTSLRDTSRWLKTDFPVATFVGDFALNGPITATSRALSMPSATVTLGADTLEGALVGRLDEGGLALSGTLAADSLDLTPFLGRLLPDRDGGGWSREPIGADAFAGADLDLRLSANSARIGPVKISGMAASVMVRDGRVEIALARASAYKGSAKGRFSLTPAAASVEAKLHGTFERLDLAAALGDTMGSRRLSGTGHAQVAVEATGASVADLARSLKGKASVFIKQGEIAGLDLAEAVRRAERRPLSAALDWRAGRTPFDQLSGTLAIADGVAEVDNGTLNGTAVRTTLAGRILVADRAFAMYGNLGAAPGAPAKVLPFEIRGGWDDPQLRLDVQTLIQRSGAAAPLLGLPQELRPGAADATGSAP